MEFKGKTFEKNIKSKNNSPPLYAILKVWPTNLKTMRNECILQIGGPNFEGASRIQ